MKLRLSEIERMLAATMPMTGREALDHEVGGYSIDSRSVGAGDLFFAIRGPRHDGHDYVEAALKAGAAGAVVAKEWLAARRFNDSAGQAGSPPHLAVDDPSEALRRLAAAARKKWARPVVGITGSNGKTTTKETVSALLAVRHRVSKSEGNLNNEFGLPLSLLRIPDDAEVGVLEMGMNHRGEIARLAAIAQPTVGVVTNVNAAHLEFFDSVDEIARAKRELIEALGPDGTAVLNASDSRVRDFAKVHPGKTRTFGAQADKAADSGAKPNGACEADFQATGMESLGPEGMRFRLRWRTKDGESHETGFVSPLPGRHNVSNVAAAIAVASVFGIEPPELVDAVAGLKAFRMRGEFVETNGIKILNDCYNANPAAVIAMLDVLAQTPGSRRVAVLGEMLELGPESSTLHRQVGEAAARAADAVIAVRGHAEDIAAGAVSAGMKPSQIFFFADAQAAGDFLAEFLEAGDAVLFKASRGVGLERALEKVVR